MNEGRELTYEQPLAPGEARLDVGRESVGIAWRLSAGAMRGALIRDGLILGLVSAAIASQFHSRHRFGGRIDWVDIGIWGMWACIWLGQLAADVMLGQATLSVLANAERLAWSAHPWQRQRTLAMFDVREFAVEPKPRGYALVVHPRQGRRKRVRWYQFRRRAANDLRPIVLLTHTDPVFAYRAAEALNALLAQPDDLTATPFLPPPPSPDPPS